MQLNSWSLVREGRKITFLEFPKGTKAPSFLSILFAENTGDKGLLLWPYYFLFFNPDLPQLCSFSRWHRFPMLGQNPSWFLGREASDKRASLILLAVLE